MGILHSIRFTGGRLFGKILQTGEWNCPQTVGENTRWLKSQRPGNRRKNQEGENRIDPVEGRPDQIVRRD